MFHGINDPRYLSDRKNTIKRTMNRVKNMKTVWILISLTMRDLNCYS